MTEQVHTFIEKLKYTYPLPVDVKLSFTERGRVMHGDREVNALCSVYSSKREAVIEVSSGRTSSDNLLCLLSTLAHEYRHVMQVFCYGVEINGFVVAAELDASSFGLVEAKRFMGQKVSRKQLNRFADHEARMLKEVA